MSGHHFHFGYLHSQENIPKLIATLRSQQSHKVRKKERQIALMHHHKSPVHLDSLFHLFYPEHEQEMHYVPTFRFVGKVESMQMRVISQCQRSD